MGRRSNGCFNAAGFFPAGFVSSASGEPLLQAEPAAALAAGAPVRSCRTPAGAGGGFSLRADGSALLKTMLALDASLFFVKVIRGKFSARAPPGDGLLGTEMHLLSSTDFFHIFFF